MNLKKILKRIKIVKYFYYKLLSIVRYIRYIQDYIAFNRLIFKKMNKKLIWKNRYVCLNDKTDNTSFDTHYVYHTGWAARKLMEILPAKHIDISSSIYFNAIVSAFIPIEFYDYRPAKLDLSGLLPYEGNLSKLSFKDNSIDSLSCMYVIEHIGLGRYGDILDPLGDIKAAMELQRVLKVQGNLLIVVPVGKPNINFNAHRVYSYEDVTSMFNKLDLKEFSLLTDDDKGPEFLINASPKFVELQNYGCGCFWFQKLKNIDDNS